MDATLTRLINAPAGSYPFLDTLMTLITQFGVPLLVLFVALQWWSKDQRPHVRHAALSAGLSFLLGLAINQVILLAVHRVRPYDAGVTHLLIAPSADWSFPSDHATASFSVVFAFMMQGLPRRTLVVLAGALLVAWSRIYVGTHYVTDILGGMASGLIAAVIVRRLWRESNRLEMLLIRLL